MPLLKVGKNHIDTDKIARIVSPSTQGVHADAVTILYVWGGEQVFLGDEAATLREWLASQFPSKPDTLPITTKVEQPRTITKK